MIGGTIQKGINKIRRQLFESNNRVDYKSKTI